MMRISFGILFLTLLSLAQAEEFDAKVIAVMDGDTVLVLHDGKKLKVRMSNIDAPELDQEFGKESRDALASRVLKKQVRINSQAVDVYGRMIGEVSLDGQSVNEAQVNNGMAWEYSHFHRNKHYRALNQHAQQTKRGLWAQAGQPISPEQWRKMHAHKYPVAKSEAAIPANTSCGKKHLCSQMKTCEEAKLYLLACGVKTLDGNGDGVPCESLCAVETVIRD
jgi:endonuclease YncB( thermonuclease family)